MQGRTTRISENEGAGLVAEAERAATSAYAPYSRFRVGAAVLDASGNIFRGANVENASYGLTLCAERVALAHAKASGCAAITAVAVACIDAAPGSPLHSRVPCGACRQWLVELAPDADIFIAGEAKPLRAEQLLPVAFTLPKSGT